MSELSDTHTSANFALVNKSDLAKLYAVTLTHKSLKINELQNYSLLKHYLNGVLFKELKRYGCKGVVLLETCNRVELYLHIEQKSVNQVPQVWSDLVGRDLPTFEIFEGESVARHLFKVAAGLESAVLGESEILSQVKQAYFKAAELGFLTPSLNYLFHVAIVVGKRVREKTRISEGHVSVASVAVSLAERLSRGRRALVIGAGALGSKLAHILVKKGFSVTVANRTFEKASELCEKLGCKPAFMYELDELIKNSDVIFAATSSERAIITQKNLHDLKGKLLFDLSTQNNVELSLRAQADITILDLEDVKREARLGLEERASQLKSAEEIVEEAVQRFVSKRSWTEELIKSMYQDAEVIRQKEVERALRVLAISDEKFKKVIEAMSKSIVNKILEKQTSLLRRVANEDPKASLELIVEMLKAEVLSKEGS
jgi:glutamyl-tRNA reductase